MTPTKVTNENPQTIDAVKARIADGTRTATATAEDAYARISEVDPEIHAYLALSRERAMKQAQKIDAMATAGETLPPLAGVPIGIKDVLNIKGAPATAGSKILAGYNPPYDSTAVARLEAAGAVFSAS